MPMASELIVPLYNLRGLSTINLLLGKNGSGKSRTLVALDSGLSHLADEYGNFKYITPERGGSVVYNASIDEALTSNPANLINQRRQNQFQQFRQQSVALFRKLELFTLRQIEQEQEKRQNFDFTFDTTVSLINELLENIEIRRTDITFEIFSRHTSNKIAADQISSGESELISLAIELLVFQTQIDATKKNVLLMDEPDVHLHPDLQAKLCVLIGKIVDETPFTVLIATHSTAIVAALADRSDVSVAFLRSQQEEINFQPISKPLRKILPIFGAHPLSNIFNKAPVLLVEGEDDVRIWQTAIRTSSGSLSLYPVEVDGEPGFSAFENLTNEILASVYDDPKGFSIRDRDDGSEEIINVGFIVRAKLSCRESENLLLSDDVLGSCDLDWEAFLASINHWLDNNEGHASYDDMVVFQDNGFDRKRADIKGIRNVLSSLLHPSKSWEVLVGKTIGAVARGEGLPLEQDNSLKNYLGAKICAEILGQT